MKMATAYKTDAEIATDNLQHAKLDRFPKSRENPVRNTLAMILAGGEGTRLLPLTRWRCKPAVPIGGKYRIIDFTLSNCINSGIRHIGVLVQYKSHTLMKHLQKGWNYFNGELDEFIDVLPAQQQTGKNWYTGTANAIFQNLDNIRFHNPKYVLILAGDHIYKADYRMMIDYHIDSGADVSVGGIEVPASEAHRFGIMETDADYNVVSFKEKPKASGKVSSETEPVLASMGIYVFNTQFLLDVLQADADIESSAHDFGASIIPAAIGKHNVVAYPFSLAQQDHYWKDVGTLDAYYQTSMDLISVSPEIDLYDESWPIWTHQEQLPPAKFILNELTPNSAVVNSLVSAGCIVSGSHINHSILHQNVRVEKHTQVTNSIILPGVVIGENCTIKNAIIEECSVIPAGTTIDEISSKRDNKHFVTDDGITIVCGDTFSESENDTGLDLVSSHD